MQSRGFVTVAYILSTNFLKLAFKNKSPWKHFWKAARITWFACPRSIRGSGLLFIFLFSFFFIFSIFFWFLRIILFVSLLLLLNTRPIGKFCFNRASNAKCQVTTLIKPTTSEKSQHKLSKKYTLNTHSQDLPGCCAETNESLYA